MKYVLFLLLCLMSRMAAAQTPDDSVPAKAAYYFGLVSSICAAPEGRLWNKELAGPVLLVEPATRNVYANVPDKEGLLVARGQLFTGVLPKAVNIANTAATWAGVKWTMVLLPLPASKPEAVKLLAHELFHRVQDELGFAAGSPVNDHLDSQNGRIYFRLELEALKAALRAPIDKRCTHLEQAILFRKWRYALFPAARAAEEALELNEGLAEFTGVYVSGVAKDTGYLPALVEGAVGSYPTFARSFAYITGPLYGMLLTQRQPGWQLGFSARDNFPDKLATVYSLHVPAVVQEKMVQVKGAYNELAIRQQEARREEDRLIKAEGYMHALVEGPLLCLTLSKKMSFSFNPSRLFPLGEYGTVYPTMTMTDEWGRLVVSGDARMRDWRMLFIALPKGTVIEGQIIKTAEWELTLVDGWMVKSGERAGDFVVSKQEVSDKR
ncbi:MAG: hypothetical protein J7621_02910 [Niastella sp.]|nr:hypothetical protein [Niastella sp.]